MYRAASSCSKGAVNVVSRLIKSNGFQPVRMLSTIPITKVHNSYQTKKIEGGVAGSLQWLRHFSAEKGAQDSVGDASNQPITVSGEFKTQADEANRPVNPKIDPNMKGSEHYHENEDEQPEFIEAPKSKGIEEVYERVRNIITNVTDKKMTKILHILCGDQRFLQRFTKANYIDLYGCHDDQAVVEACRGMKEYTVVEVIKPGQKLNFSSNTFQIAVAIIPFGRETGLGIDVDALFLHLLSNGIIILGMPETLWTKLDMANKLQNELKKGFLLVFLKVKCEEDSFVLSVLKKNE